MSTFNMTAEKDRLIEKVKSSLAKQVLDYELQVLYKIMKSNVISISCI